MMDATLHKTRVVLRRARDDDLHVTMFELPDDMLASLQTRLSELAGEWVVDRDVVAEYNADTDKAALRRGSEWHAVEQSSMFDLIRRHNVYRCACPHHGSQCPRFLRQPGLCTSCDEYVDFALEPGKVLAPPDNATKRRVFHLHKDGEPVMHHNGRRYLYIFEVEPTKPAPENVQENGHEYSLVPITLALEFDERTRRMHMYDGRTEIEMQVLCDCDIRHANCPCMQHFEQHLVAYNTHRCTYVGDDGEPCSRFLRTPGTCWRHSA
jgi:hypothetical protein